MKIVSTVLYVLITLSALSVLSFSCSSGTSTSENNWIDLLSEENLSNWTIKMKGYKAGINFNQTFQVSEGKIKVDYTEYDSFEEEYGHIFYNQSFDCYHLKMDYRFLGEQVPGGAGWAFRNSGIMLHSQSAESMTLNQDFPISLEAQFLGGNGVDDRPTMNLCTPGTHVNIAGQLETDHCISSTSETFHGDQWVSVEIIVLKDSLIQHLVNGEVVMEYTHPVIGGGAVSAADSTLFKEGTPLKEGYLALQAESHPVEFRNIKIRKLDKCQYPGT